MNKIFIILALSLNLIACATSSDQPDNGAVVGVALDDSTSATDGNAAVGALVVN